MLVVEILIFHIYMWNDIVGLCCSKLGMITCCGNKVRPSRDIQLYTDLVESLRIAILRNDINLAAELWIASKHPMCKPLFLKVHVGILSFVQKLSCLMKSSLFQIQTYTLYKICALLVVKFFFLI